MNNLVLVRHGQSIWNKERRFTGWVDVDLTDQGVLEAVSAGNLIKELKIEFNLYFTSKLKRAIKTLEIINKVLNKQNMKTIKTTALNERHYGGLTSLNKDETIKKYGYKQVQIWRRGFNTPPPLMSTDHPYKKKINSNVIGESLKDTFDRVIPYYKNTIEPQIIAQKNILIALHGNSCRAILMKILNISEKKIPQLEVPTGNPILIQFDDKIKVKSHGYLDAKRAKKILFNI